NGVESGCVGFLHDLVHQLEIIGGISGVDPIGEGDAYGIHMPVLAHLMKDGRVESSGDIVIMKPALVVLEGTGDMSTAQDERLSGGAHDLGSLDVGNGRCTCCRRLALFEYERD